MEQYREIITKAVVASGQSATKTKYTICTDHKPVKILGCWVVNHKYEAKQYKKTVKVIGVFDINVWYSYVERGVTKTDVLTEQIKYEEKIKLDYQDEGSLGTNNVIAKAVQQPNCLEAKLCPKTGKILVIVEKKMYVEVIGETKLCVRVSYHKCNYERPVERVEVTDDEFASLNTDFISDSDHKM